MKNTPNTLTKKQNPDLLNPGLAPALLLSTLVTFAFGAAVSQYFNSFSYLEGGLWMLAAAGTGWVVTGGLALRQGKGKRAVYWLELGKVMTVGVLILVPVSAVLLAGLKISWIFPLVSVLLSSGTMFFLHRKSTRKLGINPMWTAIWFASLQSTALIVTLAWAFHYAYL